MEMKLTSLYARIHFKHVICNLSICILNPTTLINRQNCTIDEAGEVPAVLVHKTVHIFEGLYTVCRHVFHHNLGQLKQLAGGVTLGMDEYISTCKKKTNVIKTL